MAKAVSVAAARRFLLGGAAIGIGRLGAPRRNE
jgi:hypothetical protein